MNAVSPSLVYELRPKIVERRARLEAAARSTSADYVNDLLAEVDATLQRIDNGSYGLCETCHDTIETDRLERNPLTRFCLDHLTGEELRAHEQDLELATRIQARLLPAKDITTRYWETHFRYQPLGVVGGDYCEIVPGDDGNALFFAVGDVAERRGRVLADDPSDAIFAACCLWICRLRSSCRVRNGCSARALLPRTATLAAARATENG